MKLLIATYGTDGDVRPLVALARRWMQAGHEAILLADEATLGEAWESGVPCSALAGDISGLSGGEAGIARLVNKKTGNMANALAGIANRHAASWLQDILHVGRDADGILASGLAVFSGLSAGERLGLPVVGASFIPLTPTRAFASPFLPPARWPNMLNGASHRFVNHLIWRAMRGACNEARDIVAGMPPRQRAWSTHPVLYGISPTVLPRPADWPARVQLCGQWLQPTPAWSPPPALASFLRAGPAPVYVGFGSMMGFDRERVWREVLAGLQGRRAILAPGWAGLGDVALPDSVFVLDAAPHDALFLQVSAVVHHGGSGTSHSATRAGRPSVVVAFAGDQAFWGSRLHALGVAAPPLAGQRLRGEALTQALQYAERAPVRASAEALGECMRREDGTGLAVAALQRLLTPAQAAAA